MNSDTLSDKNIYHPLVYIHSRQAREAGQSLTGPLAWRTMAQALVMHSVFRDERGYELNSETLPWRQFVQRVCDAAERDTGVHFTVEQRRHLAGYGAVQGFAQALIDMLGMQENAPLLAADLVAAETQGLKRSARQQATMAKIKRVGAAQEVHLDMDAVFHDLQQDDSIYNSRIPWTAVDAALRKHLTVQPEPEPVASMKLPADLRWRSLGEKLNAERAARGETPFDLSIMQDRRTQLGFAEAIVGAFGIEQTHEELAGILRNIEGNALGARSTEPIHRRPAAVQRRLVAGGPWTDPDGHQGRH